MIQRLGSDVISELRSGVALSSLSQCVEELVLNSIDAGSTSITVDVDLSTMFLEVSDNGSGMRQSDLKDVGQRYFTSKCHSLHDLQNANSYGFRGEALASLGKICQKVEIISRHKTSGRTFCKCFRKGWDMGIYESTSLRPRHGTTIKAFGVFYALPVRQKLISEKVDLEQIRRHVLGIALMNAGVSFLVRNNGTSILHINACSSAFSVISQVIGCHESKAFKPVFLTTGAYTITGYVNLEGYPNRNFQYFYVNKRLVLKTKFHHVANQVLRRAVTGMVMIDQPSTTWMVESTNQDLKSCSPKKMDRYAGFVINLECPYNTYDITFDPKKTLVEFQHWDEPISCLRGCLLDFLKKEGIFVDEFPNTQSDSQESCPGLSEEYDVAKVDSKTSMEHPSGMKRPIKANDLKRSLCSSTAKRKRNENAVCETGDYSCKPNESGNVTNMAWISKTEDMVLCKDCPFSCNEFSANGKRDVSLYNHSSVSLFNKVENLSKRSIITKLQRYSTDIFRPGNVCLSDSRRTFTSLANNCSEQPSRKTAEIGNNKVESLKSDGEERKCLEMSSEVSEISDVCFERKIIPSEQCNDSKTLLVANHYGMGTVDATISINQDKPPITKSRSVRFKTVNTNVTSSTAKHCAMVEANNTGDNQWRLKDFRMLGFKKENSSDFFPEASTHMSANDNSVMAKPNTTNPTTCNIATSDTADESGHLKDSDWLLQYNPRDGRPLYVNLRTGNTSVTVPNTEPALRIPLLEKQTTPTEQTLHLIKPRPFRNYASHLSHNFTPWLPRSVAPGKNCIVSKCEEKQSSEISDMFGQWVNPVFQKNEKLIMDASFTESSKTWVKPHSRLQPFKFTKGCFRKMKVINQVDNKFILCHYKGSGGSDDGFLVAVDQHAAHERVRLETFIQDLYADSQDPGDKMMMKSSLLSVPCKLSMSDHDVHLMQAFRVQLAQVGITFEDSPRSSSDVQSSVCIKTVPSVFLAREYSSDGEKLRDEITKCIEDLVKEQIEAMLSTKGAKTTALPKAITKVLNSQACHGAIRFGDSLSTEECVNLMASLSTCNLPFQCAHGRPSMIPLINATLTQIGESRKVTSSPQISRIRKLIKGKII